MYPKVLQFFKAGARHRTRAFIAGNRVGKSDTGAFETTLHVLVLVTFFKVKTGSRLIDAGIPWLCSLLIAGTLVAASNLLDPISLLVRSGPTCVESR